jgi:hypothetical protein
MGRCLTISVVLSMVLPPSAGAGEHLVDRAEITARLRAAHAERASNQAKVEQFLSLHAPAVVQGESGQRASAGLAALSDDEMRDLANRAEALQADPVAGGVVKTLLILGIIVLVVVLIAAAAIKSCKEQGAECLN